MHSVWNVITPTNINIGRTHIFCLKQKVESFTKTTTKVVKCENNSRQKQFKSRGFFSMHYFSTEELHILVLIKENGENTENHCKEEKIPANL